MKESLGLFLASLHSRLNAPPKIIYYVVIGNCIHILSTLTKSLRVVIRPYNVGYFVFSAWSKFCHIISNNHCLLSTCDS